MWDLLFKLAVGTIVAGAAAYGVYKVSKLTFDIINDWLGNARNKHPDAVTCELKLNELIGAGKYNTMKIGLFNNRHEEVVKYEWEADELSDDLKQAFRREKKLIYTLN